LTENGDVKLGDLNVSKVNHGGLMFTQTGTPYYASPEVWKDKPYDAKSDIWSLGCVLYEVCALKPPFTASNMKGLYNKVIKGSYQRIPQMYSDDLAAVIDMCLQVMPSKRPAAAELLRKKEVVTHLRDCGYEEEKKESSTNLLATIKLPSNFRMINDKLPTSKYDSELETVSDKETKKARNYSARGRIDSAKKLLADRERSLSALKRFQQKPGSSNSSLNVNRVKPKKCHYRPPMSNRPAYYKKNNDRPGLQLPPIARPAGIPSLAYKYRSRESSDSSRVMPIYNRHHSIDASRGYRRRADIASRQKIQQRLISKAFGLPMTPIHKV
jgi:serine/threonine protein kinase